MTNLVAQRVTWVQRPQATVLPAVTLTTLSDDRPQHLAGFESLMPARVQVDCWADTHAAANNVAEAMIAALVPAWTANGWKFARSMVDGKRDLGEQVDTKFIHRVAVDLIVHRASA